MRFNILVALAHLIFSPFTFGEVETEKHVKSETWSPTEISFKIEVNGIQNDKGNIQIALYQKEEHWLKLEKAFKVIQIPAKNAISQNNSIQVELENIPLAPIAISVIHDENLNKKLDMRWLPYPKPKEGVGISRLKSKATGKPSYKEALFTAKPGSLEIIPLFY